MKYYLKLKNLPTILIKSPFREDNNPTCSFYYSKSGRLYLHDFGTGEHIDCIEAVKKLYKLNFKQALDKIIEDSSKFENIEEKKGNKRVPLSFTLGNPNFQYFYKFGISDETLEFFNVVALKSVYADETLM